MRVMLIICFVFFAMLAHAAEQAAMQIDACTILSKAEAEKIVGEKIKEPQKVGGTEPEPKADTAAVSNCTYASLRQTGSLPAKSVYLWIRRAPAALNDSDTALDQLRKDPKGGPPRDVVGLENLGEAAFWISGKQGTQTRVEIAARKKDVVAHVILTGFEDAIAAQAKGREVIEKAFEKLGVNK